MPIRRLINSLLSRGFRKDSLVGRDVNTRRSLSPRRTVIIALISRQKLASPSPPSPRPLSLHGDSDAPIAAKVHSLSVMKIKRQSPQHLARVSGFKSSNISVQVQVRKRRNREGIPTGRIMIHPAGTARFDREIGIAFAKHGQERAERRIASSRVCRVRNVLV
jgi:hypothetical protein